VAACGKLDVTDLGIGGSSACVAVAERQHLRQAARDLNLAQSAASHAISTLEDEFRVKLFDRVGRRIELTAAGRLLLEEAHGILARAAIARLKMSELGDVKRDKRTSSAVRQDGGESGQLISLREHTHQKSELFSCRGSRHLSTGYRTAPR
jgi:DNA-binding transcriptional LysR family regulator